MQQTVEEMKERLAKIEKRIEELEKKWRQTDYLADDFPLGAGFGRRRGWQKRFDRSFDLAKELLRLKRERDSLRTAILNAERAALLAEARKNIEEKLRQCKPGDEVIDEIYGRVTVVRVNRKTITIRTTGGYQEARPFDYLVPIFDDEKNDEER